MKLLNFSIISLLVPFCLFASGQDVPKLSLSASAKIYKPADELQMKIGVITHAINAEDGLLENSSKMREIIDQLKIAGLDHDDYETNQFSINPTYTPRPKNPPPDWRQTINGYEIKNFILIHTDKLDMAGQIIDLANREGANSITDIRFGIRSPRDYWAEAISAAGFNAVQDAQAIANATGVQLVRVLSISLSQTNVRSPQLDFPCFAKAAGGEAAPPIEPGEVTIEAHVNLVYEIN